MDKTRDDRLIWGCRYYEGKRYPVSKEMRGQWPNHPGRQQVSMPLPPRHTPVNENMCAEIHAPSHITEHLPLRCGISLLSISSSLRGAGWDFLYLWDACYHWGYPFWRMSSLSACLGHLDRRTAQSLYRWNTICVVHVIRQSYT